MFTNLLGAALLIFGFSIWLGQPETWRWPDLLGAQFVIALKFVLSIRPISVIFALFLGVACFMVKKKY